MTDLEIVATYSSFLSRTGIRHLLGGSLASSAWGEQRQTNDADFVLELPTKQVDAYLRALPDGFHVEPDEVIAAASGGDFASFQTLYVPIILKIDNFVAQGAWEQAQLERAIPVRLTDDVAVPLATAEDMIVAKCRWFNLGNRISDRQWNDLVRLYEVQRDNLDASYIERWLASFDLLDLWAEIRRQALA